jgi:iron(III) transport system substrate-binding protein
MLQIKRNPKKWALVFLCAGLVALFASCKGKSSAAAAASGPAGKIVIYTSMYEDIIEAVDKALETQFPGCDIEFFYGGTGALQAKIAAEQASGKLGCDMLMVAEPSYS